MVLQERPIHFDVVTSSSSRYNAFANLLGAEKVRQVPFHFTEEVIRKPVNHQPAEWPFEIAEQKALQDVSALLTIAATNEIARENLIGSLTTDGKQTIRLYSDTVQVVFDNDVSDDGVMILEKPKDLSQWLNDRERGAMAQSGKRFEIATALTGIDLTNPNAHPATILVRFAGKMRPYTMEDIQAILKNHGPQDIMTVAGGISIQNGGTGLYDKSYPLRCYIQTDPNSQPSLAFELPTWVDADIPTLQRYVYGAVPQAVTTLLSRIENSKYVNPNTAKDTASPPHSSAQA